MRTWFSIKASDRTREPNHSLRMTGLRHRQVHNYRSSITFGFCVEKSRKDSRDIASLASPTAANGTDF
ncbi:hypothetical protein WAI453_011559 [Rhynchosporium graminicola]